jgi:hypothetical protein
MIGRLRQVLPSSRWFLLVYFIFFPVPAAAKAAQASKSVVSPRATLPALCVIDHQHICAICIRNSPAVSSLVHADTMRVVAILVSLIALFHLSACNVENFGPCLFHHFSLCLALCG